MEPLPLMQEAGNTPNPASTNAGHNPAARVDQPDTNIDLEAGPSAATNNAGRNKFKAAVLIVGRALKQPCIQAATIVIIGVPTIAMAVLERKAGVK